MSLVEDGGGYGSRPAIGARELTPADSRRSIIPMDQADRLSTALQGRYRLDGPLGRGGMAVVFRAHDLRHDRAVALKVLRAELGASLGADRFLLEIRHAAQLQHPHILPMLDSGEVPADASGPSLLWFTMPLVEGESLRDRIRRGAQPIEDVVRWSRELAEALAYAHGRGIVHRDLKPENVLLSGGHALLADFGLARALERTASDRITESGMAVGTPAYMSPEQAVADPGLDGRTDLYSLGCVMYELLAGEPPYTGPTAQAVIAKRLLDPVPSVRRLRETVPPGLDRIVERLLAKAPADRYGTAEELLAALDAPSAPEPASARPRSVRIWVAVAIGVALFLALLGVMVLRARARGGPSLDAGAVAVLPFRVTAPDHSLDYLGEGMVDLFAVKLGGPSVHPAPVRQVLSYLHYQPGAGLSPEEGNDAARRAGAGLVLDGSVVRTGGGLQVSADLRRTDGRGTPLHAAASGPVDSLPSLVDQVAASLLAGYGGGSSTQLGSLSNSAAIAEYLQGKVAHRQGRYRDAVAHFSAALQGDSTFALAALDMIAAADRTDDFEAQDRSRRLAYASRGRLSPKGAALLRAWVGPNYPAPSSLVAVTAAFQDAVRVAPDVADAWFELGDRQFHYGLVNDQPHPLESAVRSLGRALELDSTFLLPLDHLILAKLYLEDTTDLRTLARVWSARDTVSGDRNDFIRWRLALALGDSTGLARERSRFDRYPDQALQLLANDAQTAAVGVGDVGPVLEELRRRAVGGAKLRRTRIWERDWLLNLGRPAAALALTDSLQAGEPWPGWTRQQRIDDAVFQDGDTVAAAADVRALSPLAASTTRADSIVEAIRTRAACRLGFWAMSHGDVSGVRRWAEKVRGARLKSQGIYTDDDRAICGDLLGAWLARNGGSSGSAALLARADSIYLASDVSFDYGAANIVTARVREAVGDLSGARTAIGRVGIGLSVSPEYQSTYLREQGRLALAAGDTAAAVIALRRYVALRSDPEPSLRGQTDSARTLLASLLSR